jgi:hypothetical protein
MDSDEAGQRALEGALDWTKVSTGLATGALVFGVGLLGAGESFAGVRWLLVVAWLLFGISVLFGIFAQASLPVMMKDKDYDLERKVFTYPARIHQVAFLFAIAFLLWSLISLLYHQRGSDELSGSSAMQAMEISKAVLPRNFVISKLEKVALLPGPEKDSPQQAVWHFQFSGSILKGRTRILKVFDVLVSADSTGVRPSILQSP